MLKRLSLTPINIVYLVFFVALFFAFVLNWPLVVHMRKIIGELSAVKTGFIISMPFILVAALNFVLVPFSFRPVFKPFFVVLLLLGSLASYASLKYSVVFDREMIRNIAETNTREASSYLSWSLLWWFVSTGVLPSLVLLSIKVDYTGKRTKRWMHRLISMGISLAVFILMFVIYTKDYMSVGRNNPSLIHEIIPENFIASTMKFVNQTYLRKPTKFRIIAPNASRQIGNGKPTLMFLVIGETARSESLKHNGYYRDTTPFTHNDSIKGLVPFNHVRSCGTSTSVSVPCMFSDLPRTKFDPLLAANSENALDVLQKVGVKIFWIENDGSCKGVCDRVPHLDIKPDDPSYCNGKTCFDDVMLKDLNEIIGDLPEDRLIAFHMIGSHGPDYSERYPPSQAYFQPDCRRNDIENCTQEELVNSYDNTIRFTDDVLYQLIKRLEAYEKDYNTLLLFVSDHGESLGENGLYLHGAPYMFAPDQQTLVPLTIWMSPGFIKDSGIDIECLAKLARKEPFSHDNIFATLLGIWKVKTVAYDSKQDIFTGCRSKAEKIGTDQGALKQ